MDDKIKPAIAISGGRKGAYKQKWEDALNCQRPQMQEESKNESYSSSDYNNYLYHANNLRRNRGR